VRVKRPRPQSDTPSDPASGPSATVPRNNVLATVFVTGAAVLVIEIAGARAVAPLYGTGLYSWSALIAVTLAALSLGYWGGGRIADRRPSPWLFHTGILLAGLVVIAVPWIARGVLKFSEPLDPRLGVMLAALLLFFPPLALLGGVTPFAIRLARPPEGEVGGVSGLVFAVSTIGSLLAALATGFVLIPNLGLRAILSLTGAALVLVAAAGFFGTRSRVVATGVALLALLPLLGPRFAPRPDATGTAPHTLRVVARTPSFYGDLRVVETDVQRLLTVNGIGQNYVNIDGTGAPSAYLAFLAALPRWRGSPRGDTKALLIGLGAGELVGLLTAQGLELDVVELDPRIEALARQHFGLALPRERIHFADGRAFVERDREKYDYLFMDAFLGEEVPGHLFTRQALHAMRQRLKPGGVLAINYTTIPGGEDVRAVTRTLQSVFPDVRAYTDGSEPTDLASVVLVASMASIVLKRTGNPSLAAAEVFLAHRARLDTKQSRILTDDFNPIQTYRLGATRLWRQLMIRHVGEDWAFWTEF
jgi:spermidine synthase